MRKLESLFYKINTFLQKTTTCIALQTDQIFSVNILYTYFFNFGRGVWGSFFMLFRRAPASCHKTILKEPSLYYNSISMNSKSMSQIFKILFQTGDINIFVLRGFFYSRYVELKSSFSNERKT